MFPCLHQLVSNFNVWWVGKVLYSGFIRLLMRALRLKFLVIIENVFSPTVLSKLSVEIKYINPYIPVYMYGRFLK